MMASVCETTLVTLYMGKGISTPKVYYITIAKNFLEIIIIYLKYFKA